MPVKCSSWILTVKWEMWDCSSSNWFWQGLENYFTWVKAITETGLGTRDHYLIYLNIII